MEFNKNNENPEQPQGPIRVRLPRENQLIGILEQRLGAGRMLIKCMDSKSRNCRVKGNLRKRLWLREGDIVLIQLWELDKNRGDVIFKYNPTQVHWLKIKGHLKTTESEF